MINNKQKISCPKCGAPISDDVLIQQLEEQIKKEIESKQAVKDAEFLKREAEMKKREAEMKKAKDSLESTITEKVAQKIVSEKIVLAQQLKSQVEKEKKIEMNILEERIKEKDKKLSEITAEALKLRLDKQSFESEKRDFELEKQRQLDKERKKIEENAIKRADEDHHFKDAEKEKQINDMRKQIEELKRKAEQGSQQTQGEVLELELEDLLKQEFPRDEIVPVAKGKNGADIIQKVFDNSANFCGQIIWESKKAKAWKEAWIQKLKDDQRNIKADIAVIVSTILPEDMKSCASKKGVWISDIKSVAGLATALRMNLVQMNQMKIVLSGKKEKAEAIYEYLNSVEFRQRVEAICEAFKDMRSDLEKEKVYFSKIWAQRDIQINKSLFNMVGMYGDLNELSGRTLPQVKTLELPEGNENSIK